MDRGKFEQFIVIALIGSASAERYKRRNSDLTAWGIGSLIDRAKTYCDSAWNLCSESNFTTCVLFAELIGSAGFDRDLHRDDYLSLFDRAERLAHLEGQKKE
ncbi:hypothetical protein [Coleofasciculus sp.]|uniref:hypothetical protein n=1 Tax=Coleofasciculus sp. TaxID=3100458 RepID=UPI0039F95251